MGDRVAKKYSPHYEQGRAAVLYNEHVLASSGLPTYNNAPGLPPLLMEESDSWMDVADVPLAQLTNIITPPAIRLQDRIALLLMPHVLTLLRSMRLIKHIGAMQNFMPVVVRLRVLSLATFEELIHGARKLTIRKMQQFLPHMNFEVKLQLCLFLPTDKLIRLVDALVENGHAPFVARVADSLPDVYFVSRFSRLSERTAQKILPYIQRIERFTAARELASTFADLPRAIVQLMKREERLNAANSELAETLEQIDSQRTLLEQSTKELDHLYRETQRLADLIKHYIPKQLVDVLLSQSDEQRQENRHKRRRLTVFFSDVKDFTQTSDSVEPETLAALLNSYLNEMVGIANKYGATIDKFIGDAIVIFFGDPTSLGEREDAANCLRMALEMRERMFELREEWHRAGFLLPFHIRMGINTGFCTVGDFGSHNRKEYTIIGGEVNLASRLESKAEVDGILVSESTYVLAQDTFAFDDAGELTLKGFLRPVHAYALRSLRNTKSQTVHAVAEGFVLKVDTQRLSSEGRKEARRALALAEELLSEDTTSVVV